MRFFVVLFLIFLSFFADAQTQGISGVVTDMQNGEPLFSAIVLAEGSLQGVTTDENGLYSLDLTPGRYNIECRMVGYKPLKRTVVVVAGKRVDVSFSLTSSMASMDVVEITGEVDKRTAAAVNALVLKSPSMLVGISSEDIRKVPARNTADVLRRLSGTTIQDNKFVVVRGMNDRYNMVMLNGFQLPSTEADRRAFAFDIFPSEMLDNLVIVKTAMPDLPAEFSGGIVQLNLREVPEQDFTSITQGFNFNSQSTFKPYSVQQKGRFDWLGLDDGSRALDEEIPFQQIFDNADPDEQKRLSKLFTKYSWEPEQRESMPLGLNTQYSIARTFKFGNDQKIAIMGSVIHNRFPKMIRATDRNNVDAETFISTTSDSIFRFDLNTSAVFNSTIHLDARNRIMFNMMYNVFGVNQVTSRIGLNINDEKLESNDQQLFTSNQMYGFQLRSEHRVGNNLFTWGAASTELNRTIPAMRSLFTFKNTDASSEDPYRIFVQPNQPSVFFSSMFFSEQKDANLAANVDLKIPFKFLFAQDQNYMKFGYQTNRAQRDFNTRTFSYVTTTDQVNNPAFLGSPGDLFTTKNVESGLLVVKEATRPFDAYLADQNLNAFFGMADVKLSSRLNVVGGLRYEQFTQRLKSRVLGDEFVVVDSVTQNILPSFSLNYKVAPYQRIRASFSKTLSRPSLREIAPFAYFNFEELAIIEGNQFLKPAAITNYDLRYEYVPTLAQLFAINVFYKSFINPIEQAAVNSTQLSRNFSYQNAESARSFGVELEVRTKLSGSTPFLRNFTLSSNLALIQSRIRILAQGVGETTVRPLQGQSPYVINTALNYEHQPSGLDVTVNFNRVGRRIWQASYAIIPNIWEAPRTLLDLSIAKRIYKNGELRLSLQDILNQPLHFYMDTETDGRYTPGGTFFTSPPKDQIIQTYRFGTTVLAAFTWKF
jgi:outer membrane receptor protein involved in Fe transport